MLLLTLILALAAAEVSASVRSIRDIDFHNFTYPTLPTGKCSMRTVRLTNGKYESSERRVPRKIPSIDCWSVTMAPVVYGDATGDGREEAMIVLYAELGGTESSSDIFVYSLKNARPVLLWKFETGDRAQGGLVKIYAEGGQLVLELAGKNKFIGGNFYGHDDTFNGACCPTVITRSKYQWIRGAFRLLARRS
jgi:hypothetical protein